MFQKVKDFFGALRRAPWQAKACVVGVPAVFATLAAVTASPIVGLITWAVAQVVMLFAVPVVYRAVESKPVTPADIVADPTVPAEEKIDAILAEIPQEEIQAMAEAVAEAFEPERTWEDDAREQFGDEVADYLVEAHADKLCWVQERRSNRQQRRGLRPWVNRKLDIELLSLARNCAKEFGVASKEVEKVLIGGFRTILVEEALRPFVAAA